MRPVTRPARAALALLAVTGLAWLAPSPAVLPALGALRGGLPWLALGAGLAALALRRHSAPRLGGAGVFGLAAAVLVPAALWQAAGARVSGDEPHYLLMAQSLAREGDLDLRDNFARRDWAEYLPELAGPHYGAPRRDGRPFPAHSPGLPLLLALPYAAGGRPACVALMALLAAGVVAQSWRLARCMGAGTGAALAAATLLAGPPLLFYACLLYTEVPSALALVTGLGLLLGAPGAAGAALAALAASALPWLHLKMVPAAAGLGLVALARLRGGPRRAFVAVAALTGLAFLAYHQAIFGRPTPLGAYGGFLPPGDVVPQPLRALAGLLLDRSFGLLPVAPGFLLAAAGVGLAWRRRPSDAAALLGLLLAVAAPVLSWRMWWGGQCPPARFLVPALPLLAPLVAARLEAGFDGLAAWWRPLWLWGWGLAAWALAEPGRYLLLNRRDRPTRLWESLGGDPSAGRLLPSLVFAPAEEWRVAAFWLTALGLLLALDLGARARPGWARALERPWLPVALLLAAVLATDLWARSGPVAAPAPAGAPAAPDKSRQRKRGAARAAPRDEAGASSRGGAASGSCPASARTGRPASAPARAPPRPPTRGGSSARCGRSRGCPPRPASRCAWGG